jgi:DNA-binding MarR family transcriptional regulator
MPKDAEGELPSELRVFLHSCIASIGQVDLLLLMRASGRTLTAREIASELRVSIATARRDVETLAARGLLEVRVGEEITYRYRPKSEDLARYCDLLAGAYSSSRELVLRFVAAESRLSIKSFSDAFKLRDRGDQRVLRGAAVSGIPAEPRAPGAVEQPLVRGMGGEQRAGVRRSRDAAVNRSVPGPRPGGAGRRRPAAVRPDLGYRMTIVPFIYGAVAMGCAAAAVFFLRFWRHSRDRLFMYFATAFGVLAVSYVQLGTMTFATESRVYVFVVRLVAFCIILWGIFEKNRR